MMSASPSLGVYGIVGLLKFHELFQLVDPDGLVRHEPALLFHGLEGVFQIGFDGAEVPGQGRDHLTLTLQDGGELGEVRTGNGSDSTPDWILCIQRSSIIWRFHPVF